jgi:hypothetical protein
LSDAESEDGSRLQSFLVTLSNTLHEMSSVNDKKQGGALEKQRGAARDHGEGSLTFLSVKSIL